LVRVEIDYSYALLLLLFSSFSTVRAGHHCRASCWVGIRYPVCNAWFFEYYSAVRPVHLQLLVPLTLSHLAVINWTKYPCLNYRSSAPVTGCRG